MNIRMDQYVKHIQRKYEKISEITKNGSEKIPNLFTNGEVHVYTNVQGFECPYKSVYIYNYSSLGDNYKNWIDRTTVELSHGRTGAEIKFSKILSQAKTRVIEQPYFRINGKGYFLDFYLPQYGLAFELNGCIHKGKKNEEYDFERDYDFHTIGIKTIRLTNSDIYAPDIKDRINDWATRAYNGNFDPALYYSRTDNRRFEKKKTRFQIFHEQLNATLRKQEYKGKVVILRTDWDYFQKTLKSKRYNTSSMVNKDAINEFYDIIEGNEITFNVYFVGHTEKMKPSVQMIIAENNNDATEKKPDYVISIIGSKYIENDENIFNEARILQYYGYSNKEKHFQHVCFCPYDMYFPYIKPNETKKKKKYKSASIVIGDGMCSICKYCASLDRNSLIVKCRGYENAGNKSIHEHMKAHSFSDPIIVEHMGEMSDFRNKEEYSPLVKYIEKSEEKYRQQMLRFWGCANYSIEDEFERNIELI